MHRKFSLRSRTSGLASAALLVVVGCQATGDIEGPPADEPGSLHNGGGRKADGGGAPDPGGGGAPTPPGSDGGAPTPPPGVDGGAPTPPADTGTYIPKDTGAPTSDDTGAPPVTTVDSGPPSPPPPPPTGAYPSGPYGYDVGSVFPNVSLPGYRDGTGAWTTITSADLYDPTGARKINGIFLDVSASWCGACQAEAGDLPGIYASYKPHGARFVTVLIEDTMSAPAGQSAVDAWQSSYHLPFDLCADPSRDTLPKGGVGLPHNYVIDPRTMQVVKVIEGSDGTMTIPGLDALLTKNGG